MVHHRLFTPRLTTKLLFVKFNSISYDFSFHQFKDFQFNVGFDVGSDPIEPELKRHVFKGGSVVKAKIHRYPVPSWTTKKLFVWRETISAACDAAAVVGCSLKYSVHA